MRDPRPPECTVSAPTPSPQSYIGPHKVSFDHRLHAARRENETAIFAELSPKTDPQSDHVDDARRTHSLALARETVDPSANTPDAKAR